jgi:multisubunit Na+/H+ antiporter MnhC subunit
MSNFVSFIAVMTALVIGLALLSIVFAVVLSIAIRAFQGNT